MPQVEIIIKTRLPLIKHVAKQIVYGVVYEPDTVDLQDDYASASDIEDACHNFMLDCQVIKLSHKNTTEEARIIESFIAPVDYEINGQGIKKGSWVMGVKIRSSEIWSGVMDGQFNGFSMGGTAEPELQAA